MATNNFKPFAVGAGANVTAQADYEALAALVSGFTAGKASSAQVNKALRQSTALASVLAQFIANTTGNDVLDDGNTAIVLTNLIAALKTNGALSFLQTANNFSEIKSAGASAVSSALANLGSSDGTLKGRLLNVWTFTSSQTCIATPGTQSLIVEIVGAGAGTDAAPATAAGQVSIVTGGGAGAYAKGRFASAFNGASIIIGSAGTAGVSGAPTGTNGGTTSFGSLMTTPGGIKGSSADPATPPFFPQGGLISTSPSGGNIVQWNKSGAAPAYSSGAASYLGSPGASSPLGSGGFGSGIGASGTSGSGYGSGGGGPCQGASGAIVHRGMGSPGVCIIYEYA